MTIARQNLAQGTIKLTITIPAIQVSQEHQKILAEAIKNVSVPGFRKGKAPQKLAEEKIDQKKLLEQVINQLVPKVYQQAIQKEGLNPIINPQIKLLSAEKDKDWQIEIQTCEAPAVDLGNYQEQLAKDNAVEKIWTPEKGKKEGDAKTTKKDSVQNKDKQIQKIIDLLLKIIKVDVPALLIENELNRKLAGLIDKTEKLGMTIDQYLVSTSQTIEKLKEKYRQSIGEFFTLEFILNKIADNKEINVADSEIEKFIQQAKEEKEKKALASQKYYIAQLIRRQKTLDFLLGL